MEWHILYGKELEVCRKVRVKPLLSFFFLFCGFDAFARRLPGTSSGTQAASDGASGRRTT